MDDIISATRFRTPIWMHTMRTLALILLGTVLLTGCDNKYAVPPTIPIPEQTPVKHGPNMGVSSGAAKTSKKTTHGLSEETEKAWENAGFIVSWVDVATETQVSERDVKEGVIPIFTLTEMKLKKFDKLPQPEILFGIHTSFNSVKEVADEELKQFATYKQLAHINFSFTNTTDKGVKAIAGLPNLKTLKLSGAKISDDGARSLKEAKNLVLLDLSVTEVTKAGFAELKKALPNCKIKE
jgi:Leucine Rich repeat